MSPPTGSPKKRGGEAHFENEPYGLESLIHILWEAIVIPSFIFPLYFLPKLLITTTKCLDCGQNAFR